MPTATKAPAKAAPKKSVDVVELDDLAADVDALRKLKARIAKLESQESKLVKAIKEKLGSASAGTVNGEKVVSWATTERKTVSVEMIKTKFPEIADACVKVIQVRTFQLIETP